MKHTINISDAMSFNNAQTILGSKETNGRHELTNEQLFLCAEYAISHKISYAKKTDATAGIESSGNVYIVFYFEDSSHLKVILNQRIDPNYKS